MAHVEIQRVRVYAVVVAFNIEKHADNLLRAAETLHQHVEFGPVSVNSDDGMVLIEWEFDDPADAQKLHDKLAQSPACGMHLSLQAQSSWEHGVALVAPQEVN